MRRIFSAVCAVLFCLAPLTARADRIVVYPNQNPTSAQFNQQPRFVRLGLGTWMRDALGATASGGVYANLSVVPNGGMNLSVVPTTANTLGSLYQIASDDTNTVPAGGGALSLSADATLIVVQALQPGSVSLSALSAPGSGLSQYYLIEAQVQTVDTTPQNLLFISNVGVRSNKTVNIYRQDQIVYQVKAGTAASTPTVPSVDSNWIGIATVLVPSGTSTLTSGMISALPPFAGFVQSVSASGVLSSSGGITPTITCAACISGVNTLIREGVVTNVPADGSANMAVTFTTAFPTALGVVTATPANYSGTDNAAITCRIVGNPTLTGFSIIVSGGQTGSTVSIDYRASGH